MWAAPEADSSSVASVAAAAGWRVYQLDLTESLGKEELLAQLRDRMEFPPHFRPNWDATADCLKDLPGGIDVRRLLVVDAGHIDAQAAPAKIFLEILAEVSAFWSRHGSNFSVVWIGLPTDNVPALADL